MVRPRDDVPIRRMTVREVMRTPWTVIFLGASAPQRVHRVFDVLLVDGEVVGGCAFSLSGARRWRWIWMPGTEWFGWSER